MRHLSHMRQEEQRLIDDIYETNEEEWFDDFYYDDM